MSSEGLLLRSRARVPAPSSLIAHPRSSAFASSSARTVVGVLPESPTPNPQSESPTPNPQSRISDTESASLTSLARGLCARQAGAAADARRVREREGSPPVPPRRPRS
eukprot:504926-Rhodomonas_salina.2